MKRLVETIQGPNPSSTRRSVQGITGRLWKQMLKPMLNHVISVKGTATNLGNPQSILLQWWPLGPLPSRDLTFLVPFSMGTRQMKFLIVGIALQNR